MVNRYRHLIRDQRCQVAILKVRDKAIDIPKIPVARRSTISRELERNSESEGYK